MTAQTQRPRWMFLLPLSLGVILSLGATSAYLWTQSTGVRLTAAAKAFLETLDESQQAQVAIAYDDAQRVDWHYIPKAQRKGVELAELNEEQSRALQGLLRSALSQIGYEKVQAIMALEKVLFALEKRDSRDPLKYNVTLFGNVSESERWGMSFEGHHLSINLVVEDEQVVGSTPQFLGANPAIVQDDYGDNLHPAGTRVLEKEETIAFELLADLSEDQRAIAIIATTPPRDVTSGGQAQAPEANPQGLSSAEMTSTQAEKIREILAIHASTMPADVAGRRFQRIEAAGWDAIHFAWLGATEPGIGHAYVIEGPTFRVEVYNTQPDSLGNPANHIHCLWRDLEGDFAMPIGTR